MSSPHQAVAYGKWLLASGSKWETFGISENWSLRRGGHSQEVVATALTGVLSVSNL